MKVELRTENNVRVASMMRRRNLKKRVVTNYFDKREAR